MKCIKARMCVTRIFPESLQRKGRIVVTDALYVGLTESVIPQTSIFYGDNPKRSTLK